MNPSVQSGMHPDAESLAAFAEQLLPEVEREQVLAHMATCSRCREVVFLAQQSAEEPAAIRESGTIPTKPRGSWFKGWQWAWVPVAAFAGFIGVAVVQHFRHAESETQMTAKLSQADASRNAEPGKAPVASPQSTVSPTAELQKTQKAKPSEVRDDALTRREKGGAKQFDEKKSVEGKDLSIGAAGTLIAVPPGASGGSVHGTMAAKAKSSPSGGPAALNQLQQQNLSQDNSAQENILRQSQSVAVDAANKPVLGSPAPATASEAVTMQAETKDSVTAAAPSPAPQGASLPLTGQNYAALSAASPGKDKLQKITLPSGLGALSMASEVGRNVALDTAGAMFLSEDGGKHWQPIQTQWTGRALLVRTRPVGTQNGALRAPQTLRFELVNDKLQTWISYDGKTWTAQPALLN
jgi:hypothetical protein